MLNLCGDLPYRFNIARNYPATDDIAHFIKFHIQPWTPKLPNDGVHSLEPTDYNRLRVNGI